MPNAQTAIRRIIKFNRDSLFRIQIGSLAVLSPMNLADQTFHLLNFVAPALAMALLLPLAGRLLMKRSGFTLSFWAQVLIHCIVGVGVLFAGIWFGGRDGKMASYAALVLISASVQWLMSGGWRRA